MPDGIPYPYKLDDSFSILRVTDCLCVCACVRVCVFLIYFLLKFNTIVCMQTVETLIRRRVWSVSGLCL